MKTGPLTLFVLACTLGASVAANKANAAERQERRETKHAKAENGQARAAAIQKTLSKHLKKATATEFERKNSDADLLRAKLTYSTPNKNGNGHVAYLCIQWGDLDKLIPNISPEHYSNWDGSVKLQQAGKASVIKEFAFDDRNKTTGGVERRDGLGRDSGKKPGSPNESGSGSGRDTIIRDSGSSMVAWKSGVVGATDGLMIRLELKRPETRGTIQAGNFTIPFEVAPRPQ